LWYISHLFFQYTTISLHEMGELLGGCWMITWWSSHGFPLSAKNKMRHLFLIWFLKQNINRWKMTFGVLNVGIKTHIETIYRTQQFRWLLNIAGMICCYKNSSNTDSAFLQITPQFKKWYKSTSNTPVIDTTASSSLFIRKK